ncbi:MAG: hypothetical protein KDD41_12045 [Flavobacteriales bacterium]|nr:hypothetical protein [Flavobacteriales bacterium]
MNFKELFELGHSRLFTDQVVQEVITHPERMEELMQLFAQGPVQITQRAAWCISVIAEKHPEHLHHYYELFIKLLKDKNNHPAVARNIFRALQFTEIPEKYQGKILTLAFDYLNDNSQPIAIRAFSMTVIFNLSEKYTDIVPELRASIEALLPDASAGLKNRGYKILKRIAKK